MKIKRGLLIIVLCFFTVRVDAVTTKENLEVLATKISNFETNLFLKTHPIESIYITTKEDESTKEEMALKYGGEWEVYGENKVLRGTTGTAGSTGGNSEVKLNADNLPSHTHSFTPSGTATSQFSGTSVTLVKNTTLPSATFSNGTALSKTLTGSITMHGAQIHTNIHFVSGIFSSGFTNLNNYGNLTMSGGASSFGNIKIDATHTHGVTGKITINNTTHTHYVTPNGTIADSKLNGNTKTTEVAGRDASTISPINVSDPYITVYMYKRTA